MTDMATVLLGSTVIATLLNMLFSYLMNRHKIVPEAVAGFQKVYQGMIEDLERQVANLKTQMAELEEREDRCNEVNRELRKQISDLERNNKALLKTQNSLKKEIDALKRRLASYEKGS